MKLTSCALACVCFSASCGDALTPPHACESVAETGSETLGALASRRGIRLGDFTFFATGSAPFVSALAQFDMVTVPVFFNFVEMMPNEFDFTLPDAVADATPPATPLYVPGLITNDLGVNLLPPWLQPGAFSGAELQAILVDYVSTVVDHFETKYPGRVIAYEVVVEPLSYEGTRGIWNQIGLDAGLDQYEYIRIGYATARAAAPHTKLYIDDFGAEDLGPKSDTMYELVSSLLAENVPIDGVGLECHYMIETGGAFPQVPSADDITANMNRLAALGLDTMITSADISILDSDLSSATLAEQAQGFQSLVHACLSAPGCKAFSTWGVGDADSWILQSEPGWGSPLLFDTSYTPKPAYDAVMTELSTGCLPADARRKYADTIANAKVKSEP